MTNQLQRGFSILAVPAALRVALLVLALAASCQQIATDGALHAWWDRQIMDVLGVFSPLLSGLMTVLALIVGALVVVLLLGAVAPESGAARGQLSPGEAARAGSEAGARFGARFNDLGSVVLLVIAALLGLGTVWTGERLQRLGEPVMVDLAAGAPLPEPGTLVLLQGHQVRAEALVLHRARVRPARSSPRYLHFLPLHADTRAARESAPRVLLRSLSNAEEWRQVSMPVEGVLGAAPRRAVVSLLAEDGVSLHADVRELRADINRGNLMVRRWMLGALAVLFTLAAIGYGVHQRRVARRS
jgi:hypothetical protein